MPPAPTSDYLNHLQSVITQRRSADPEASYIAKLFSKGDKKIAQKVGEEAVEVVIAAMEKDREEIVKESADLLFHWLILLVKAGIPVEDVLHEMHRREGTSGLAEKSTRKS